MLHWLLIFAQAQAAGGGAGAGGAGAAAPTAPNPWVAMLPFVAIFALLYLMFFWPQQKQERKRKEMIAALKKNDRVMTAGGIFGTIANIDPASDKVTLRVDDDKGVKLTLARGYIVRVVSSTEKEKEHDATKSAASVEEKT